VFEKVERWNKAGESGTSGHWEGQVHLDGNRGLCIGGIKGLAAAENAAREVLAGGGLEKSNS
jgi:hypothetical protein